MGKPDYEKWRQLGLPAFDIKLKNSDRGVEVFDIIRKKFIRLTPEEWVRQHFVHYLINSLNYPRSLIRIESGHRYNELMKRSDIIVYDRSGKAFMLAECKSATEKIDNSALYQVATYNHSIRAQYIAITNGIDFICGKPALTGGAVEWMEKLPYFPDSPQEE
jgi:predicted type IV restriction endonuclease